MKSFETLTFLDEFSRYWTQETRDVSRDQDVATRQPLRFFSSARSDCSRSSSTSE